MRRLGCTFYLWSAEEQDRFLREALGPSVGGWLAAGLAEGFWFDRFGARGPHLFFVLTTRNETVGQVARELRKQLEGWLATTPLTASLSAAELEERHAACRGKTLCSADRIAGFATHGSFEIFDHPIWDYPFSHGRHLVADRAEAAVIASPWRDWTETTQWTIARLGKPTLAPAMRWLASIDRQMDGDSAADFWRHCLRCLLPELPRLESLDKIEIDWLARLVDEKNSSLLRELWELDLHHESATEIPDSAGLVRAGLMVAPEGARWKFLREVVFVTLKQMRIRIPRQAQLYAFALKRRLRARGAGGMV